MWPLYLMGGKDEANNMATHIIGGSKSIGVLKIVYSQ